MKERPIIDGSGAADGDGDALFGAISLLFAIQQWSAGVIWLSFRRGAPLLNGSICDLAAESGSYTGCSR